MPAYSTTAALPVEELSAAIVEGENAVEGLIGTKILGELPITWRNAHLVKATLAGTQGLREISADKYVHAPGTRFERLVATFGEADVTVTPRGVEIAIPRELTLDSRNRFDVEAFFAARFGNQISGLTKEKLIAAAIFSTDATTGFGSATNSTVAYTAALLTTNSFIGDMILSTRRLKARGEAPPYVAVMSGTVFERIRQAATVQSYAAGVLKAGQEATQGTIESALKEFGITELLIGDAYTVTSADMVTPPTLTAVWNNTYIWVGKKGTASGGTGESGIPIIGGVGVFAFWEGYADGGIPSADSKSKTFDGGNYVETYMSNETDSVIIRVKMSHKPTILNNRAGDLIATQYS